MLVNYCAENQLLARPRILTVCGIVMLKKYVTSLVVLLCVASISHGAGSMTNSWAVQVRSGGKEAADALASKYGFINLGLVSGEKSGRNCYNNFSCS